MQIIINQLYTSTYKDNIYIDGQVLSMYKVTVAPIF